MFYSENHLSEFMWFKFPSLKMSFQVVKIQKLDYMHFFRVHKLTDNSMLVENLST